MSSARSWREGSQPGWATWSGDDAVYRAGMERQDTVWGDATISAGAHFTSRPWRDLPEATWTTRPRRSARAGRRSASPSGCHPVSSHRENKRSTRVNVKPWGATNCEGNRKKRTRQAAWEQAGRTRETSGGRKPREPPGEASRRAPGSAPRPRGTEPPALGRPRAPVEPRCQWVEG